jgi:hypothetical protein
MIAELATDSRALALLTAWRRLSPARRSLIADMINATVQD